MAAFVPDALSYEWTFPIVCLKIEAADRKFSRPPGHRDYLGALVNLGIERSMLGDILTEEGCAYVFCVQRMEEFICRELTRVGRSMVYVKAVDPSSVNAARSYQELTATVASARLYSVIGAAFATSRSGITGLIEGGRVFVNGKMVTSNGHSLKEKDIVSVRGMGKFQYMGILSQTKKGRCRIWINRYR